MRRRVQLVLVFLLLLCACNPEKKSRRQIDRLEKSGGRQNYEIGIACMQYILKHGEDLAYSKILIGKLLDMGFPAESIYAAEWLMRKYPDEPQLFFFRGIAYRRLHQYALAQKDLDHALSLEPGNDTFMREAEVTKDQYRRWFEIQSMDTALGFAADSFNILLNRAEHFYVLQEYDAVLYDLGSISKMRAAEDSIFYARKVSSLYAASGKPPVEKLTEMLEYFRRLR